MTQDLKETIDRLTDEYNTVLLMVNENEGEGGTAFFWGNTHDFGYMLISAFKKNQDFFETAVASILATIVTMQDDKTRTNTLRDLKEVLEKL